jgi:hypothetical protein
MGSFRIDRWPSAKINLGIQTGPSKKRDDLSDRLIFAEIRTRWCSLETRRFSLCFGKYEGDFSSTEEVGDLWNNGT